MAINKTPIFVAKTRNYDIFVAKIYDYALIDSFWGFRRFIDSPTSYATLAVAGEYWNTSGLLPILLILVNLEAKGPRVLFFLLFPRCRLTNHGNQVSATALIFTSPPTFSSGEEAEQRSASTTLPTHCPAVLYSLSQHETQLSLKQNTMQLVIIGKSKNPIWGVRMPLRK